MWVRSCGRRNLDPHGMSSFVCVGTLVRAHTHTIPKTTPTNGSNLDARTEMTVCAHHEAPTYSVENENHNSSRDHTETIERRMIPTMTRSTAILWV